MSVAPYVIIGGSVAGLIAAIKLAELGQQVIVLEGNHLAPKRLCGEFISPECLPLLKRWGIHPACTISQITFHHQDKTLDFDLPKPAGSLARQQLELKLVEVAKTLKIELREHTQVNKITQNASGKIQLALNQQEILIANHVIVSAGRFFQKSKRPKFLYKGMKAHFCGDNIPQNLIMHITPDGYFGTVPIDKKTLNVAALMTNTKIQHSLLQNHFSAWKQKEDWLECYIPKFGLKPTLNIPQVYFVGDAMASIPPITGNGVGMGITSGLLVAAWAHQGDWQNYRNLWRKQYAARIRWGKLLHHIALAPNFSSRVMSLVKQRPAIAQFLFERTRA